MSRKIQITIVQKQAGEIIDSILDSLFADVSSKPIQVSGQSLQELIPHIYNENYKVHQGKCFQQNSPNLCGYHAIFNTFCFLKMLNGGTCDYDIQSGASFWRFKIKVENFLLDYKWRTGKYDEWPWREKDILYGDFERTFNQVCMERFQEFKIFRKHENFYYISHTWEFQYQNLIGSLDSKIDLNDKFMKFQKYTGDKPLVLHLMLAITTHWLTFIAIKASNKVEYWFFDSFNNHYLDFDWQQITQYIQMKNEERIKFKKPALTNFQKETYSMCMKDVQTSLRLIVGCLEGRDNIETYSYNRSFHIFAEQLDAAMCVGHDEVSLVIKDFKHDIRRFFQRNVEWKMLYPQNHQIMKRIVSYSVKIRNYNHEGNFLHNLLKNRTAM